MFVRLTACIELYYYYISREINRNHERKLVKTHTYTRELLWCVTKLTMNGDLIINLRTGVVLILRVYTIKEYVFCVGGFEILRTEPS